MKRILCVLLVLVVALSVCVFGANAAEAYEYTDKYGITYYYAFYEENGSTKALIGYCKYDKAAPFTLTFPSKLGGYPVGAIADECFRGHKMLEGVKFPDSLEYIGEEAFYGAPLKSVTIPKNVSYIGLNAFGNVDSYNVASQNKYYKSMDGLLCSKDGKYLINYPLGRKDTSYTVPEGIEYIVEDAFTEAKNLKKLTLPESLIGVGEGAVNYTTLDTLYIGKNVEYIGENAFSGNGYLKNVTIHPEAMPYIDRTAFGYPSIKYDGDVGYIGHIVICIANNNAGELKNVTIKEGMKVICPYAFESCYEFNLSLPASATHIPMEAFEGKNIREIKVSGDNPYYASVDGALYTNDKKTLLVFPAKEADSYKLADTTEAIYSGAFKRDVKIHNLVIPESVEVLYDGAFSGVDATIIKFEGIPEYVGEKIFTDCYAVKDVILPDGCAVFGIEDFRGTGFIDAKNGNYLTSGSVMLGYKKSSLTYVNVFNTFTAVGRKAFYGERDLVQVTISDNVVAIGDFAFANCPKLKEVYIPATVDEIGRGAFGFNVTFDEETGAVTSFENVEGFVIKGYTNSLAESYADANGFEFISVGYMEPESTLLGDIDCDGKLTVRDATALQKYVAGMVGLNTQDKINADFNEDGKINVRDATAIQKRIAKIS